MIRTVRIVRRIRRQNDYFPQTSSLLIRIAKYSTTPSNNKPTTLEKQQVVVLTKRKKTVGPIQVESIETLQRKLTMEQRLESLEQRMQLNDFKMKLAYAESKEERGGHIFAKKNRGMRLTEDEERVLSSPSVKEVRKQIKSKPKKHNKGYVPQLTAKAKGTRGVRPLKYQDPTGAGRSQY